MTTAHSMPASTSDETAIAVAQGALSRDDSSGGTGARPGARPKSDAIAYCRALFDHPALADLWFGLSGFRTMPEGERDPGLHVWGRTPDELATLAAMQPMSAMNVHARLTPVANRPDYGRGDSDCAAALVAFGADVDIAHPVHAKTEKLPPNESEARRIIDTMDLAPSMLVDTGHGLHAYRILAAPWIFADDDDRAQAKELAEQFHRRIVKPAADSCGYAIDSCFDLARVWRVPDTMNGKDPADVREVRIIFADGPRYTLDEIRAAIAARPAQDDSALVSHAAIPVDLDDSQLVERMFAADNGAKIRQLWQGDTGEYQSHSEADAALCSHLAFWTGRDAARMDALFRASGLCREKWTKRADYRERTIHSAIERCHVTYTPDGYTRNGTAARVKVKPRAAAPNERAIGQYPLAEVAKELSDIGNAARFAEQHGDNVKWCEAWGCWLPWDGKRYRRDDLCRISDLMMQTALSLFDEARREKDDGKRKAIADHAARSQRKERLAAMRELAKPMLAVSPEQLDADNWILNCQNGALGLRTGELREHSRDDLCTKIAGVDYDPDARCPLFERFVNRIFDGDRALIDFIQRLLGHCLTGDISEQILAVPHGTGANGKSVLFDTVLSIMGEYADVAAPDLFMQRSSDEHPTEVADLAGKRLIVASETEKGRRLRVQLVKRLTGDKTLKGRFMRQDYFTFQRRFKAILVTNNKPRITEDSEAVWRRIRLIPFGVVIPQDERDKALTAKLIDEGPGILAWLVRGCIDWQRHGLGEPRAVKDATGQYRDESDPLGEWLADYCELDPAAWTLTKELRKSYTAHAEERGDKPLGTRSFADALTQHGCTPKQRNEGRGWLGIRLISEVNL